MYKRKRFMLHIILSCFYPHKKCMSPAGIFHKDSERALGKTVLKTRKQKKKR